ncbi:MAG: TIGR04190 family B12-binding domain/radical SAM domain protein [Gemmatimonadaceae bacterium]|nr:TIGR04190 family B12-binding domain/radical SAM domain protein [Gemmatimonadaceae bacterium]
MSQPDVVLIHPPSIYDFRERTIFYGPISDVIPSSPIFEMYPIGFVTLAAYLRRHGYRTRIVNLALRMMRSRRFRPERFLRRLRPRLFGIDLHWLPHAHGGPEVAALLKRLHPDIPIVFGGISSSYFHEELIQDPAVDFVLRGSVTEPCLLALVRELEGERRFDRVPNLTWKQDGAVRVNPASFAPPSLDEFDLDLGMMVASVVSHLDFWTSIPFQAWWRHPITAVLTVRGCARGCVTCGASDAAFKRFMAGRHPLFRGPDAIAAQVRGLASFTRAPIFLVGDINDGGPAYARAVVEALGRAPVANRIVFEFFEPPPVDLLQRIDAMVPRWGAELSPESHDEAIRTRLGKARYTNEQLEAGIASMLALRCENLDMFFMIGLPGQSYGNVLEMVDAIERLFSRFDRRLSAFITPMGPFIDPGSDGFEQAEAQGYRIRAHTLAEHRALLDQQRDWESFLNYSTDSMTRAEIVDATYDGAERLNALKAKHRRIEPEQAAAVARRMASARALRRSLAEAGGGELDPAVHSALLGEIRAFSEATVNDKAELFPPGAFLRNFRVGGILRLLARELLLNLRRRPRVQEARPDR